MRSRARHGTTEGGQDEKDLVAEAGRDIETLSGKEAATLVGDPNVVFVDVREGEELQKTGKLQAPCMCRAGFSSSRRTRPARPIAGTWRRQEARPLLRVRQSLRARS